MIFLTYARIPTREIRAESLKKYMIVDYIDAVMSKKRLASRNESLAALCLLTETLKLAGIEPGAHIKIRKNELGRPMLTGVEGVADVSLGHSGEYAACAVSLTGRVGVDIEKIPDNDEWKRIARRFFSEGELASADSADGFASTWTRKEAYYKFLATDTSLACVDSAKAEDVRFESFATEDEYILSVCAETDVFLCKKPQKAEIKDDFFDTIGKI